MTTIVRVPTRIVARPGLIYRSVTGTPAEVAATVAMIRDTGRLVAATAPRQRAAADSRVTVVVTVRGPRTAAAPVPRRRSRRWIAPTVIIAASTATVAALGYAVATLARATVHAVTANVHIVLGGLLLLALVLFVFVLGRAGACPGIHCPGCRHR
jgi:hypothetical protein